MFLQDKATIGVEQEAVPGTPESLLQANYNLRVANLEYDHTIAEYKRKYLIGSFSRDASIMGKQSGTFSFYIDIAGGTGAAVANPISVLLNACGILNAVQGTTGVLYTPYTPYANKTCTVEIVERDEGVSPTQLVMKFAGCAGNCRYVLNEIGQPVRAEFEMQGKLVSIADRAFGSLIVPDLITTVPVKVLSATFTHAAVAQVLETFTLDFGNEIQAKSSPAEASGIEHFYISGREPKLTCNPYVRTLAGEAVYTQWLAGTTGALSFAWGSSGANLHTIAAPVAQYVGVKPVVRNGARAYEKSFLLVKSADIGDDEWSYLQGSLV